MRVVREHPPGDSPNVMHHAALNQPGQTPYNIRWHSSREEMWELLMGRHERCGSTSLLRFLPSDGIAWKRIAEFACAPVSHVDTSDAERKWYWNNAPVTLAPDPRRGVVARATSSTVGVARLRVLSFTWSNRNSYEQLRVTETLGLVAQHCRELRALRILGTGGGESLGDDDFEGAEACRAAITSVLERCLDLRVLMVIDCCDFSPTATPGRTYALTHLHLGCLFQTGVTAAQFSAWITQAPNLRHFGATYYQDEDEGVRLLEAATNSHLQTLDLTGAPVLEEDMENEEGRELLRQAVRGLPENLRLTSCGFDEVGELVGELLLECLEDCNRNDLRVQLPLPGSGVTSVGPKLGRWHEAVSTLCFA